ncbi:MAG: hypothetical protein QXQ66_09945 [Candidatus Hadarchaeum sp.]|uniref:protein kinase domain-containing protein n=1 Tax=Candidatus Hadarchaeum sp. TaxID=2883567 RepID=UPI00317BBBA0
MSLLPVNKKVRLQPRNTECVVEQLLGSGGQGEVYQVRVGREKKALKWYYPQLATQRQRESLEQLVKMGQPSKEFLWPQEVVTSSGAAGFGYIMPLREQRFKGIVDMLAGRAHPSFQTLCTVCRQLSDCYLKLHTKGLCYADINFNNVFFDPDTGEILICDNDNVIVNGQDPIGVIGTPRFMAPEIVRGEAKPSADTDKYSLAVLLFYLMFVHHPLEGKQEANIHCLDTNAMNLLYGTNPVFIYDPNNASNRPVPGYHDNAITYWRLYPTFLKNLFVRAFTDGLHPNKRVAETEWRRAFVQLADSIVYCPKCGRENFYDEEQRSVPDCWKCKAQVKVPYLLRLPQPTVLRHDTRLYLYHVKVIPTYDFHQPVAKVSIHADGRWGLTNLGTEQWTATTADGRIVVVAPGKTIGLHKGLRIHFGEKTGEID